MLTRDLIVHCMAWRTGDQWVAMCLDFDLAAQGDTYLEARERLAAQIHGYVRDALVGDDQDQAAYFLTRRRAPLRYWLKFYWLGLLAALRGRARKASSEQYTTHLPLQPA